MAPTSHTRTATLVTVTTNSAGHEDSRDGEGFQRHHSTRGA